MQTGTRKAKKLGKSNTTSIAKSAQSEAATQAGGRLFVVASPIGNIRDITLRALDVLKSVTLVAAEDTRRTRQLLNAYGIKIKLVSLNEHTERIKSPALLQRIIDGEDIAYISDAGTPGISDPGFTLIRKAWEVGVSVVPIPGVSAAITALSVSGLPMNHFLFVGFLPANNNARKHILESLRSREESIVFFESPLRLLKTLNDLLVIWGERQVFVAREMTKIYEEFQRGRLSELIETFTVRNTIRGEVTIIVAGEKAKKEYSPDNLRDKVTMLMEKAGFSRSEAAREISAETGVAKSAVYRLSLEKFQAAEDVQ